jgi:hypothetical protein
MWKNNVQQGSPQMTIWRMRISCWIPKATNTNTQAVKYSLLFHWNNGCTNVPQFYTIHTLPALLNVWFSRDQKEAQEE